MAFPKLGAALQQYVLDQEELGKEKWSEITKSIGLSDDVQREISQQVLSPGGTLSTTLVRMIEETAKVSGKDLGQVHEELGEAYLFYVMKHPKWADRFQLLSPDILGFITNLDNLFHYLLMTLFDKESDAPAFRLEDELDEKKQYTGNKEIHYYSRHDGLHKVAFGFIRAAMRKHYMDSKTQIQFRSCDIDTVEGNSYEHAVFLLLGKGKRKKKEKPPKMVAETEKGAEGQLDKDTVSSIMNAIKTGNVTKTRKRWAMIKTAMAFGALIDKFEPLYPKRIVMNPEIFCDKFPYHMAFDKNLVIKHVGVGMQRLFPPLRLGDCKLDPIMELVHPPIPLTPAMVRLFPNQLFRFRVRSEAVPMHWRKDPMLQFRGQFLEVDNGRSFLFLGSPAVESLPEIRERHFYFGEIALHDKTRDLAYEKKDMDGMGEGQSSAADLQLIQELRIEIHELKEQLEIERNKAAQIVQKEVASSSEGDAAKIAALQASHATALSEKDVEIQRIQEEIVILQNAAAEAKKAAELSSSSSSNGLATGVMMGVGGAALGAVGGAAVGAAGGAIMGAGMAKGGFGDGSLDDKCLQISSSMLPYYLAQQWIELGYRLDFTAGVYEEVTVLFADVVQFSQICNQCKPDVVATVLNDLWRVLDGLTYVHDVFKVEYIGDAYVCCGGLPIPVDSHAERVCNMALAIMAASKQVLSPVTSESIKLRIGVHTGPVITGIIGEKIPRFCVYGSTLTLASRMESHGLLGRIQISPATKAKIDGLGFSILDRGEIEVRGVGTMFTHFLEGSSKSDMEILGKVPNSTKSVPMNAGGSNFYYDKSLSMVGYHDNLIEGQPVPSNPLMYRGIGKAVGRITRQKTLAQVEMKQGAAGSVMTTNAFVNNTGSIMTANGMANNAHNMSSMSNMSNMNSVNQTVYQQQNVPMPMQNMNQQQHTTSTYYQEGVMNAGMGMVPQQQQGGKTSTTTVKKTIIMR
ncbi:guanylate cyclase soluble subunit beta-2-like [Symsagittifera roscoffensis]|uniref:guanylate cyclase soluble subunit beta-2-like n=1 Tax=Symsagittifera roscoffensis TaxID=84072 RepID=UPI00307C79A9